VTLAQALTALGRWDEALEVTSHALSLLPPAGQRVLLLHLTGSIALARGDFGAARRGACRHSAERAGLQLSVEPGRNGRGPWER
jgi:hypothetical protein